MSSSRRADVRDALRSVVKAVIVGGILTLVMALSHHADHAGQAPLVVDNGGNHSLPE